MRECASIETPAARRIWALRADVARSSAGVSRAGHARLGLQLASFSPECVLCRICRHARRAMVVALSACLRVGTLNAP